jgi:hypothetical protein
VEVPDIILTKHLCFARRGPNATCFVMEKLESLQINQISWFRGLRGRRARVGQIMALIRSQEARRPWVWLVGGIASILLWGKLGINISRGLGVAQDNSHNRQAYCSIDAITT